jgi:hypothetical protein
VINREKSNLKRFRLIQEPNPRHTAITESIESGVEAEPEGRGPAGSGCERELSGVGYSPRGCGEVGSVEPGGCAADEVDVC